jgi:hypothetical protein
MIKLIARCKTLESRVRGMACEVRELTHEAQELRACEVRESRAREVQESRAREAQESRVREGVKAGWQ